MDSIQVSALASAALIAVQPYLRIIAEKTAEKIGAELPSTVGRIWSTLRAKLAKREEGAIALADLSSMPDDPDAQAQFRLQLRKVLQEDLAFAKELEKLLEADTTHQGYHAEVHGSGAVAQGEGAQALGERAVNIEGDAKSVSFDQ